MATQYRQAGYGTTSADSYPRDYSTERLTSYAPVGDQEKDGQYPPAKSGLASRRGAAARKGGRGKWIILGIILAIVIILGAVLGGVLGSRAGNNSSSSSTSTTTNNAAQVSSGGGGAGTSSGDPTTQAFALPALDSRGNPIYTAGSNSAPSIAAASSNTDCGSDPFTATGSTDGTGTNLQLRPGHPRLIAPAYRWNCLRTKLIPNNGYLRAWNDTIMQNATQYAAMPPTTYVFDGGASGSGALDISRATQLRIKLWGYAYQLTNDTKWSDRAWQELYWMSGATTAAGSAGAVSGQSDPWNSQHFLDVAEFTFAYALAYDWMYSAWNSTQLNQIRTWIVQNGLNKGQSAYSAGTVFWLTATGNWNCVCTNGLMAGALAIWDEETSGAAKSIMASALPNALSTCANAISTDGTWLETQDYWYFGITGHATITSNLVTATGSDQGMTTVNPALNNTGLFHMYGTGFFEKFNWGDCGPNKFTATANALLLYGNRLKIPTYSLYQRDRMDAPEPFAMHWYDVNANGTWWYQLPLDHYFPNQTDSWSTMRSSWTDPTAVYAAIKAGSPADKQTHSNLDAGDFVFEALGERWAGELCQDNYLYPGYFSGSDQSGQRWTYYRCGTSGQNTILYNNANQQFSMMPTTNFGSTGESQQSLNYTVPSTSAAYFTTDMSTAYSGASISRGLRLVAGRQAMLLRDEVSGAGATSQWRVQTNATISMSGDSKTATLALNGKTVQVQLRSPSSGSFGTAQPPQGSSTEEPNPGVIVLTIDIPSGTTTVETLWVPQGVNAGNVPNVALSSWSTTSHNS